MIKDRVIEFRRVRAGDLVPHPDNWREHPKEQRQAYASILEDIGFAGAILTRLMDDGRLQIIDGHMRSDYSPDIELPVVVTDLSADEADKALVSFDPLAMMARTNAEKLEALHARIHTDHEGLRETLAQMAADAGLFNPYDQRNAVKGALAAKFIFPPFSILDATSDTWCKRKRAWQELGIQSELGRDAIPYEVSHINAKQATPSIFDPVLSELMYTWFCPNNGVILDPFAGGSVRGIVATELQYTYYGIELRKEQVEANRIQGEQICDITPTWIHGNSLHDIPEQDYDFIFSCPPYYDLETYSDEDGDISNYSTYTEFLSDYQQIVANAVKQLKNNRFACFVVGEIRDIGGNYRNFVGDTIQAFENAGLKYYNEIILVTAIGTLPIRVTNGFDTSRKIGKRHQNVLVFVKGDARLATEYCGDVEVHTGLDENQDIKV